MKLHEIVLNQTLRTHFDPLQLIDNWDSLYQINYLDFEREGFSPGLAYRDESIEVADIEFDLAEYARNTGASAAAISGGERIEDAIGGKVPRGRHRATFCMALEIVLSDGQSAPAILNHFGFPKKPTLWSPFNETQKAKIEAILADYGASIEPPTLEIIAGAVGASGDEALPPLPKPAPVLPAEIDFSSVLVDRPRPKAEPSGGGKGGGPKKVDHKQKAHANDGKRPVRTVAYDGRFRDEGREVGMAESGWMAEGLLRDPQSVYSRQAFDHWAAIYGTSSALRDEFREGGLYPHKVRQLGSDISQMLLGKGLNRLASGSVLWSQV